MVTALLMLAVGFLLILLEFFLPGGVVGAVGALLVILSIVFFGLAVDSAVLITIYSLIVLAALAGMIYLAIRRIKKGKVKGIYLNTDQTGYVASHWEEALIGKEGIALSDLKPSGHVIIEEKRYQAVAKTGYLLKGSKIRVIGGQGGHLIVKSL